MFGMRTGWPDVSVGEILARSEREFKGVVRSGIQVGGSEPRLRGPIGAESTGLGRVYHEGRFFTRDCGGMCEELGPGSGALRRLRQPPPNPLHGSG